MLDRIVALNGRFVVFDLHSYNHRRGGPDALPDDPAGNPDVNLGTGTMPRERWAPVVEAFLGVLARERVADQPLDVRENVRFRGGRGGGSHNGSTRPIRTKAARWRSR